MRKENAGLRAADVESVFIDYFKGLFTSTGSTRMEKCLSTVLNRVTPAMNQLLLRHYSTEEVDLALSQM
jgi:ethanolamine utilization microcompartment shell protein EutS